MSNHYDEVLEFDPPHGFLIAQGKQTAIARVEPLSAEKSYLIVSNGEAFGIATLEQPAQIKTKDFDTEDWLEQHRITQRERRQWWPESEAFYVYRLKEWKPFEGVKLFENGQVIDEPRLTSEQWEIVSKAKELPKTIIIDDNFISLNCNYTADCGDKSFYNREVKPIMDATFNRAIEINGDNATGDIIPVYSLALVRNPRMRVSKKKLNAEADKQEAIEIEIEVSPESEGDEMPYKIRERDGEYCVVKINSDDTETIEKCHENMEMAQAHLDALNINVVAEEESAMDTDKPKKRKPDKKEVDDSTFLKRLKLAAKNILDIVTLAEKESTNNEDDKLFMGDVGIGQKIVNGELWHFTYSTNAFQDREGEIFSTKALEDYVANNEVSKDKGYFNLWHINEEDGNFNTDFAKKEWQGVVGRFLIEAGPYLRDERGRAARKFFKSYPSGHPEIAPEGWGCSPEFRYLPEERATGTYDTIWITRTSTLPKFAAANVWTETRQMKHNRGNNMLTKQQKEAAEAIFGSDFVGSLIQEAESKTAELEAAGVAHKEKKEEPEPETQQVNIGIDMEVLAAEVGKQFAANLDPIADAIATMADSVKQLQDRLDRLEKDSKVKAVTESPRYVFNLKRASDAETTIVTEDDKLSKQKPVETTKANANDPWSQMFRR